MVLMILPVAVSIAVIEPSGFRGQPLTAMPGSWCWHLELTPDPMT